MSERVEIRAQIGHEQWTLGEGELTDDGDQRLQLVDLMRTAADDLERQVRSEQEPTAPQSSYDVIGPQQIDGPHAVGLDPEAPRPWTT